MALESLFRKDGLKYNEGNIAVPQTSLDALRQYKFAYIADKAIKESRGDQREVLGVGKSALELAMGDMGIYNPHTLPTVHRSFRDVKAIAETAEDYAGYFKKAYESATIGELLQVFDEEGVFKSGTLKIAQEKIKPYSDLTLEQIDKAYKSAQEEMGKQRKSDSPGSKEVLKLNAELKMMEEAAMLIHMVREKYERILTEKAKARSTEEYFINHDEATWGIIKGPDISRFGHHLN